MVRLTKSTLASVLICVAAAGCGSSGEKSAPPTAQAPAAQAPPKLREISIAQPGASAFTMQAYVAEAEGIFAKHGLKAKYVTVASGPPLVAAMMSGSNTFATISVLTVGPAVQTGQDAKFACGISNTMDRVVWVRKGAAVPDGNASGWEAPLRALKGHVIGVSALGSGMQANFQDTLRAAGMKGDDVKYIAVGAAATALAALKTGKVDATVGYPGLNEQLQTEGVGKPVLAYKDIPFFQKYHSVAWGASAKLLEDDPELAKDFCAAIAEATSFIKASANAEKVKSILMDKLSMPAQLATAVATGDFAATLDAATQVSGVEAVIKSGTDAKLLKPGLAASDLIWSEAPQTP